MIKIGLPERCLHLLQVSHRSAHIFLRQFQAEIVGGLEQDGRCHHKTLAHSPVGGLAEIAALCVLGVSAAADDTDLHIRDLGTGQNTLVAPLFQMRQDQALPVEGKVVDGALTLKDQTASRLTGFQKQMHFRIVAQRFKVTDALCCIRDRLFINNAGRAEFHPHSEAVFYQALQDLPLDLPHDLNGDLSLFLVIGQAEHGVFLLQHTELAVGRVKILAGRQQKPALHDWPEQTLRVFPFGLRSDSHACAGPREPGHRYNDPGRRLLQGFIFFSFIKPELCRLFGLPLLIRALRDLLSGQEDSAGDLHPGQPCASCCTSSFVSDLVDPRSENISADRLRSQDIQHCQQIIHALFPERRTKADRKELSSRDELCRVRGHNLLPVKKALHQSLVADCDLLLQSRRKDRFGLQSCVFCRACGILSG